MRNKGIIKIVILLGIILILGGVFYVYKTNSSAYLNSLLTEKLKEKREHDRLLKYLPESIDGYNLDHSHLIFEYYDCINPAEEAELKSYDLEGETCYNSLTSRYQNPQDNKVIFIHIASVDKGFDIFKAVYEKIGKIDTLANNRIIRLEKHEIMWFPSKKIDVILNQEGIQKINPDNSESVSYPETANGQNPVTQYFINNFSTQN